MADTEDTELPEHIAVYQRFRRLFGNATTVSRDGRRRAEKQKSTSVPFGEGRDPLGIDDVLGGLTARMGWNSPLSQADLLGSWPEIAGAETAEHSVPATIDDGVLTVRCDSTAWATQLRLMRTQLTTLIAQRFPDAGITSIRFEGPNAPSWKRGPRAIPGRGPRDTYG